MHYVDSLQKLQKCRAKNGQDTFCNDDNDNNNDENNDNNNNNILL